MSGKELTCLDEIFSNLTPQMNKLDSKSTFYLTVALSKNFMDLRSIPGDIFYTLYVNIEKSMNDYNIFDLCQILQLFTNPEVGKHVPI
jgi:hypothetical protein